jgi:hypothetical protein
MQGDDSAPVEKQLKQNPSPNDFLILLLHPAQIIIPVQAIEIRFPKIEFTSNCSFKVIL